MSDFLIYSDGGSEPLVQASCACIVINSTSRKRTKLVALLGEANANEAESMAGLLGFCYVVADLLPGAVCNVRWVSDNNFALRLASAESFERTGNSLGLDIAFSEIKKLITVVPVHLSQERRKNLHHSCHQASTWVRKKGEDLLATQGEGPVGHLGRIAPARAWNLIDIRDLLSAARKETPENLAHQLFVRMKHIGDLGKDEA